MAKDGVSTAAILFPALAEQLVPIYRKMVADSAPDTMAPAEWCDKWLRLIDSKKTKKARLTSGDRAIIVRLFVAAERIG